MHHEELAPNAAPMSSPASSSPMPGRPPIHLTPRESEIVRYVMLGESNKQIARRLGISNYTVRDHVSNLLKKSGVTSRSRLALVLPAPLLQPSLLPVPRTAISAVGGAQRPAGHTLHDAGVDRLQALRQWSK